MTAPKNSPDTFQGMLDWLESELRHVKGQLADYAEQVQQGRNQIWELTDQMQHAESGAINLAAQLNPLTALPEELRALRERIERVQALLAQDREQSELIARQLRAEMQGERDERGELRRRTEFAEQAAAGIQDKLGVLDEILRRVQDEHALSTQRLEQTTINLTAFDSRLAANAETLRRLQGDARNLATDVERLTHALGDFGDRLDRSEDQIHRAQVDIVLFEEQRRDVEALRERMEALRAVGEQASERASTTAKAQEALAQRLEEMERLGERQRGKANQQDRALADLRILTEEYRETATREGERFLTFQEKLRRRQISDLEYEIREIKGFGRIQPNA